MPRSAGSCRHTRRGSGRKRFCESRPRRACRSRIRAFAPRGGAAKGKAMLKSISTLGILGATGLLTLVSGCSKTEASNPCDLLTVKEAQLLDRTIEKTQWLPAKKGESDELCEYRDAGSHCVFSMVRSSNCEKTQW